MEGGLLGRVEQRKTTGGVGRDARKSGADQVVAYMQELVLRDYPELLLGVRGDKRRAARLKEVILQSLVKHDLTLPGMSREKLAEMVLHEIAGYGPIEPLIRDATVTEIMVNGHSQVYVEREGRLELTDVRFRDDKHVEDVIGRIVAPLGRRIDVSTPYVDARLPDGSRINAIIQPLSLNGPVMTIRKFSYTRPGIADLIALGTLSEPLAQFLAACVCGKLNILVSGGAGAGKSTTLNVLSSFIPDDQERIITIEDAAELKLHQKHVVSLESRPPNIEGRGEVTIRDLVRNALRMRPDRIIVGEVRGPEALDMLQAMNTGHEGALSTAHANSAADALIRLENMALLAAEIPQRALRGQIKAAIDLVVHQCRLRDGSRKITEVAFVRKNCPDEGPYLLDEVFRYKLLRYDAQGRAVGKFVERTGVPVAGTLLERVKAAGASLARWAKEAPGEPGEER